MNYKLSLVKNNTILLGGASVARGLSAYVDVLIDNKIQHLFNETMHMNEEFLSMKLADYPDFFAAGLIFLFICKYYVHIKTMLTKPVRYLIVSEYLILVENNFCLD